MYIMAKTSKHTNGNTVGNNNSSTPILKGRYVAKDREVIKVRLGEKEHHIRRVWDSKKKELKEELIEIQNSNPDVFRRNLLIINSCLYAVGLEWSDTPIKQVGKVSWREGNDEYEDAAIKIKFLRNGGQVRLCRNTDGTQRVELDCVTEKTVTQAIQDVYAWTEDDQADLEAHRAALARRKEDRKRHETYEQNYVRTFNVSSVFEQVGL